MDNDKEGRLIFDYEDGELFVNNDNPDIHFSFNGRSFRDARFRLKINDITHVENYCFGVSDSHHMQPKNFVFYLQGR